MKRGISVLLCVVLLLSSCAPATVKYRSEWRKDREFEEKKRTDRTTTERGLKYEIKSDQVSFRGYSFTIPISKCDVEKEFYQDEVTPMAEYREYKGSQKETGESLKRRKTAGRWGALLLLGVGVAVAYKSLDIEENKDLDAVELALTVTAGGLAGELIGWALGRSTPPREYEIAWERGRQTKSEPSGEPITQVDGLKGETELECVRAPNAPVKLNNDYFEFWDSKGNKGSDALLYADLDGMLNVNIAASPNTWGVDVEDLLGKISSWKLFGYLKSSAVEAIRRLLVEEMFDRSLPINLKTVDYPGGAMKTIYNDEKTLHLPGKIVEGENGLYAAMESFIDQRINSHVKTVVIETKDYDSHAALSSGNIEASIASPPADRLGREYFKEPLMDWAIQRVSYYDRGEVDKTLGDDGQVLFTVYVPCDMQVKITHPKYHYVEELLHFGEDRLDKTLYVSELGQKMRVRIVDH
jgi:hypothetical protein